MRVFEVKGEPRYVRPGTNLTAWTAANRPYIVCNASLYNGKIPIGTIFEGGRLIHNDGTGYGVGILGGMMQFGDPWEFAWRDYLTGYNSPIQEGQYFAPAFKDSYVFDCKLNRIGIGRVKGKLSILTDDGVTLKQFANNALVVGATELVNLDGGASRHLYYAGKTIYKSSRTPYNALAWFVSEAETPCPFKQPTSNIRWGSVGEGAKWVQWYLNKHGAALDVDGIFLTKSVAALKAFQSAHGLVADGVCGILTRGKLLQ